MLLVASLGWVTSAQSALIDFNTAGDLDTHFDGNWVTTDDFDEADGVGIGATRALGVVSDIVGGTDDAGATLVTSNYRFGSPGAKIAVSAYFHTVAQLGTAGEDRVFELNLVGSSANVPTAAHTGIGGKIEFVPNADGNDSIGIEFRRNNADVAGSQTPDASAFDIKSSTWYKATFTATNAGAGNSIPATMVLDEYSADGTSLVTAGVFSHSFDIPAGDISIDPEVWAAFRVRNGTRLYNAIDNFETVQLVIPEPASVALVGLAVVGFLAIRRSAGAMR